VIEPEPAPEVALGQVQLASLPPPALHVDPARAAGSRMSGEVSGVSLHSMIAGDVLPRMR
jgi:hypothetical protein